MRQYYLWAGGGEDFDFQCFSDAKNMRPPRFLKIFLVLFWLKTCENIPLPVNNETVLDCRLVQITN